MRQITLVVVLLLGIIGSLIIVNAGNTVHVEADVIATDSYLMIEVDNSSISFGKISRGEVSDPQKVCVNNTGTENILVVPKLPSAYKDRIFNNIYIKRYGDSDSTYKVIGEFNVTINNGASRCLWLRLDLSSYDKPIYQDLRGHETDIVINAVPI